MGWTITLLLGITASIIAWYVINKLIVPKVAISKRIAHTEKGSFLFKITIVR